MIRKEKEQNTKKPRRSRRRRRKSQIFIIGAIIATIYVITIAMTLQQLQTCPRNDTREELWTLSHVYVNIKHEIRVAMTVFLAAYTQNGLESRQSEQILEHIKQYCKEQGISAQIQLIYPLTIKNGTSRTNGLLRTYANISTTIHLILRTEQIRIEDERFLQIAYMVIIRSAPPKFRAELWMITEQNIKIPVEQATVNLIDKESLERIPVETFHNGTYYSHTDTRSYEAEIWFDTGVLFKIFL
ncbi:MAG: hypothetical protein ACE5R6_03500 [Candidatus Heimdallarchaeota archaeon]